ncbi:DNA polymerase kappa isoform X2 [Genypterus blacodes]|uniref:DNA polymerase kappa isoform X2 n=1 Tax=Genypterus blacodes TaxID=154954 RepID=UPI003F770749
MAVGSMSMRSTSNYNARKFGVRAAMPGFIAKKLCPNLIIVPLSFDKYRAVSDEIREIFAQYDPHFQPLSLDEAYLDFTEHLTQRMSWPESLRTHCFRISSTATGEVQTELPQHMEAEANLSPVLFEDSPSSSPCLLGSGGAGAAAAAGLFEVFGTSVEEAVREMRFRIEQKTMLTASAGIAPNMMLAKVCSDKNKPNGQYLLPSTREAVMDFIQILPVRKVCGIGKVSEKLLKALGVSSCSDLGQQMAMLSLLFSETAWHHFMQVSLGLGSTCITRNEERKSMSTERTFKELSHVEEQLSLCRELCEDLAADMKKEALQAKTVTLKLKNVKFEVKSRASTLPCAVATVDELFAVAKDLLKTEIENESPQPLRLRLMGVRVSAFVSSDDKKPLQKSIISFLQPGKTDSCGQTWTHASLPPAQMSQKPEEVPSLTKWRGSGPGQIGGESQSFFQRAHTQRLRLKADTVSKQEEEHLQYASASTSTGICAPNRVESKGDFRASPMLSGNDCESVLGLADTHSESLTCPVCFRQVETCDLNVFNRHIDHCLSCAAAQKPNQSTDASSESDVDLQNVHQACEVKGKEEKRSDAFVQGPLHPHSTEPQPDHSSESDDSNCGAVALQQPESYCEQSSLICPVCQVAQDTGDLSVFNHHVDVCLNQEVLHELEGRTSSLLYPPSVPAPKLTVADPHLPTQQVQMKAHKSKRRDSPSYPPAKKAKGRSPRNTIDKFFR